MATYENFADWVQAFENGKVVWTVEMGGLGPGYEQALQIAAFRIGRHLLDQDYQAEAFDDERWPATRDAIHEAVDVNDLGLSGAQWGAAMNLITLLYLKGMDRLNDPAIKDRLIQVSSDWPLAAQTPESSK